MFGAGTPVFLDYPEIFPHLRRLPAGAVPAEVSPQREFGKGKVVGDENALLADLINLRVAPQAKALELLKCDAGVVELAQIIDQRRVLKELFSIFFEHHRRSRPNSAEQIESPAMRPAPDRRVREYGVKGFEETHDFLLGSPWN